MNNILYICNRIVRGNCLMINGNPNSASDYFVRDHLKAGIMNNLIGGINRNLHSRIHSWLRNEFGRADHCEFCGIKKTY